jgi:hypothetical protein
MPNEEKQSVLIKMQQLKNLGSKLLSGTQPSQEELKYIGEMLVLIGDGADPSDVLDIKGSGGWNSKKDNAEKERLNRVTLTVGWIEKAMEPEPSGCGYGLSEAIRAISSENDPKNAYAEDYLYKLWARHKELRGKPMKLLDLRLLD